MELHKLSTDEIRGWDSARLKEIVTEVRRALAGIRMDAYTAKSANAGKLRGLRKSLARLMTVTREKGKKS